MLFDNRELPRSRRRRRCSSCNRRRCGDCCCCLWLCARRTSRTLVTCSARGFQSYSAAFLLLLLDDCLTGSGSGSGSGVFGGGYAGAAVSLAIA